MTSKYAIEIASKLFNHESTICIESFAEELDRHLVRFYQLCVLRDKVDAIEKLVTEPSIDVCTLKSQIMEVLKDE